jgi:hypothetical protein
MPTDNPWRARPRARRRLHLARLRLKRAWFRFRLNIYMINTAMWVAAGALVGFEVLDALIGGMIVAPEAVPLLLAALAFWWWWKNRRRRTE